jgi:Mn-containing catalase
MSIIRRTGGGSLTCGRPNVSERPAIGALRKRPGEDVGPTYPQPHLEAKVILRYDRLGIELPSGPADPAGAKAVQELMGGRFGEMSTLMNYTFQSFSFRDRKDLRPFYDLIANIAAEEYGHIELVGATITSMLTGASGRQIVEEGNPHHALKAGKGVLPVDSGGSPWTGDYVFSSGDLVEDLTHNYFLETGARNGKLKVYEAVDHPAARALTGYLLVRGGVHQIAYARALELVTGADVTKLFPAPRIRTDKIPECRPHIENGSHRKLYRFSPNDYREIVAVFKGKHPETGEDLMVDDSAPEGFPWPDAPPQEDVFAPDYAPAEIAEIAEKLRQDAGINGRKARAEEPRVAR